MEKRTAYVANYLDEATWDTVQEDGPDSWLEATYPFLHPLVLVADLPTEEWLDKIKKEAVDEYLEGWDDDDEKPALSWLANDPEVSEGGIWSQSHDARDADHHLCIVIVVRRVEVAIA